MEAIPQFHRFFGKISWNGGQKYTTHDSIVHKERELPIIQLFLHHEWMNEKKWNQPWAAAPADDVSAELATCARNLFQDESSKSCDLLQSLVKHILQGTFFKMNYASVNVNDSCHASFAKLMYIFVL